MRLKVLTTTEELERFRMETKQHIDTLLPLEYMKRSRVVACVDENNGFCGGFVLVLKGPFRVIESIPEGLINTCSAVPTSVAEITGLWITRRWSQRRGSAVLWLRLFWEMVRSRKSHFVYAYSLRKPQLKEIYSVTRPTVLFRGDTKVLPGMDSSDRESVEMFSLWNLLAALFFRPGFTWKRRRPSKRKPVQLATLKLDTRV